MKRRPYRILMLLENETLPEDQRVFLEAKALVEAGFEVTVICPNGDHATGGASVEGVRVYRYLQPWQGRGFASYVFEYAYSIVMGLLYAFFVWARHGFDAIHVHSPPDMNALIGVAFRLIGKKFVVDMHDLSPELYRAQTSGKTGGLVVRALLFFEALACRSCHRLISTNETQQRVQVARAGANPTRCHVVRNGPRDIFLAEPSQPQSLSNSRRFVLGYVGIIGVQDGVDHFVHMIDHLRKQRDDFVGVVVGDGPALQSLRVLTRQLQLDAFIEFTGLIDNAQVPSRIASFDVCVTPDPSNPYNDSCTTIKTMEYMALGKPTIAFATAENRITAGEAALYAKENDTAELATLASQLLDDPQQREIMGAAGRRRIEQSFAWEHQKRKLVRLYEELAKSSGRLTSEATNAQSDHEAKVQRTAASARPQAARAPTA